MIEYSLKDKDGNTYSLNGDGVTAELKRSFTQGKDNFKYDTKVVENSFLPGAEVVGNKRLMSRAYTLEVTSTNNDTQAYRDYLNELIEWISKTKYIVDETNSMEIEVVSYAMNIEYLEGSLKKLSKNSFMFTALDPFWTSTIKTEYTGSVLSGIIKEQSVNNEGYLPVHPIITLVAFSAVTDVQIYIDSDKTGIQIQDSLFGTTGYETMVIDCVEGLVSIGDLNRNTNIVQGTGFFEIATGSDKITFLTDEDVEYTIDFYKRMFI